jgi:AcrR family transcriptional regulator
LILDTDLGVWDTAAVGAVETARARARAELTREIKQEARRQLAAEGASALSLRAVARELGMVSSALYRYFPSREDLLTALIIDAYDAVGTAAEEADRVADPADIRARWGSVCRAVRAWALANPHEYALVYGSPVPGYRAPQDTIAHANRVTEVLIGLLRAAGEAGTLVPDTLLPSMAADADRLSNTVLQGIPPAGIVRGLMAWTQLFGLISFELFGHLVGSVADYDVLFDESVSKMAEFVGFTSPAGVAGRVPRSRSR